jgi:hypothetical protein
VSRVSEAFSTHFRIGQSLIGEILLLKIFNFNSHNCSQDFHLWKSFFYFILFNTQNSFHTIIFNIRN